MKNKLSWLAGPYVLWMALVVIVPILLVVVYAFTTSGETAADIGGFTLDNFSRMGTYTVIFARSFQLALVATLVCLLIGYPLAYVMAKEGPGFQRVAMVIIMLPMWVNFLLRTYAWMAILENNGILNNFFEAIGLFSLINSIFGTDISFFPMIRTQGAVVLGMVYNYLPFMVLPLYNVLSKIDKDVISAARDLGATELYTFRKIIFPLSLPGVVSGVIMVFVPALTTFVISDLLGGSKILLIGNVIEQEFTKGSNWHLGSGLSLVLMIFILLSMALIAKYDKEGEGNAF